MAKEQPPLSPQMQAMEGAAAQPDSPYQSVTNLIEMIANYIYQHRNEPNVLEYFANELRSASGILANSALKSDFEDPDKPGGPKPSEQLMAITELIGPKKSSAYADREHPSADELSVRESLKSKLVTTPK